MPGHHADRHGHVVGVQLGVGLEVRDGRPTERLARQLEQRAGAVQRRQRGRGQRGAGHVALGQRRGRRQGVVDDLEAVVVLQPRPVHPQDRDRLVDRRLGHAQAVAVIAHDAVDRQPLVPRRVGGRADHHGREAQEGPLHRTRRLGELRRCSSRRRKSARCWG